MNKIMLYQHGGSYNHGCEALATTISEIITKTVDDSQVFLCSSKPEQDKKYNIKSIHKIILASIPLRRYTFDYIIYQFNKRVLKNDNLSHRFLIDHSCIRHSNKMSAYVAIGGDMYCYGKGRSFWRTDKILKKRNKNLMLWACSVEPEDLPGELAEHLKNFNLITARESLTYEALIANGLADKVHLVADPAFLLEKEYLPLPENWKDGEMVGINLSPLVLDYTDNKEQVIQSIYALIEYIIENTDMSVALIPHVRLKGTDDVTVMKPIYNHFKASNRVILFDNMELSCKQLKGYISRCRFFIGARTHSLIAAYSTYVPALALGYSVKANGIAKDIFGYSKNLVVPVQTLDSPQSVINSFNYLVENESSLKTHLEEFIPEYKEKAKISGNLLNKLINKG